ncbi:alpha-mannosidase [Hydrogenispora ethanolica]|jgi:alpha-mannosidase|uniref:Alpha-mannosidase n=1 Tax=Hydrogenispora ethanolica TaxID=1082276 RepID=A0A4V2QEM0_HYDET|nr:glycoside hydrolase family 38 C-terminal domain-containing protein [Hydrogenispora ethanolica]TCL68567.1 alpha-mannosidase [Hydrogenispora ethanolica]
MALTKEWEKRILKWLAELKNHFFRELGVIEFTGFVTRDQLELADALRGPFAAMPEGTAWGAKWEYGWFRGNVTLAEAARGKRIVIRPCLGGESAVYIDGLNAGAIDKEHREVTLCMNGEPGRTFAIIAESYAGHGPRLEDIPPLPPGRVAVPEPGPTQVRVARSTFGIWDEEAYQLWLDATALYQIRCNINENSLRAAAIDKGLKDFTLRVDFELPYEARLKTFQAGRERLRPLLSCVNGSTAPTMFIFGQSHLDLAWLWPFAETERKCARTVATQLALMDEYPEYRFLLTQAPVFLTLKERYPRLYQRVREKIASGQLIPEGGMWVEADTNLPGGESLIRQLLYGKRFFREEFGVDSQLVWLPDVFGFSAALPQILVGCGIRYFSTKKLYDNYNGGDPFPYNIFMWQGIDGSRVLTHIIRKSNSPLDPQTLIKRWEFDRKQQDDIATFLFPFGYGDGGGGPVREHLEYARRMRDLEGVPRLRYCHPNEFFEDLAEKGLPENHYVGELYFQAHRGTYTSQAKTKRGNRRAEFALREAELWGAAAHGCQGSAYPRAELERLWQKVLFNQFHDILPGTSIQRVHQEAEADYEAVLEKLAVLKNSAVSALIEPGPGLTVFNSLSWERRELVALPAEYEAVCSPDGVVQPTQAVGGQTLAEVRVPACGWSTFQPAPATAAILNSLHASPTRLENEYLRIELNDRGELASIYDKEAGRELAAGLCNRLMMYKDVTTYYDAWDIDSMYERLPVALDERATIEPVCSGPLLAALRVARPLHHSRLTQEISLRRGSRRIEFKTVVEWAESHKLLKVAFPTTIHCEEGIHEIQFGHVRRPNHHSRQYDADRFEVCNHKWTAVAEGNRGCAILNDCKYGVNVVGGCINLTLLKSALVPDMHADRGRQEFTYAFYAWNGPFVGSELIREAYELNSPVCAVRGSAGQRSLFRLDDPAIILETVKLAEDNGDLILRLYESKAATVHCLLETSLPLWRAEQTNMLETEGRELEASGGTIPLDFRPFEIKTIRLRLRTR